MSRPIFQQLETRLLLSAFPTLLEAGDHSSKLLAQDITAGMQELYAGEGSFGATVQGATQSGSEDFFKLVVPTQAMFIIQLDSQGTPLTLSIDGDAGGIYSHSGVSAYKSTYNLNPGTYYVHLAQGSSGAANYSLQMSLTYPTMPNWQRLSYDMGRFGAETNVDLSQDDPGDLFWVPQEAGETLRTYLEPGPTAATSNYWTAAAGQAADYVFALLPGSSGTSGKAYLNLNLVTGLELSEPNNTPAQASDVTAFLRDALPTDSFADKYLHVTGTHTDGSVDWYKITLDRPYVAKNDPLRDVNGNGCYGVVGPGTYYFQTSQDATYDYSATLLLQAVNDGGGFVQVQPGLWKVRLQPVGPHQEQVFSIATPKDVFLDAPYTRPTPYSYASVASYPLYRSSPGYVYVTLNKSPLGDQIPVDVYAYEVTKEIGDSATAPQATPLKMLPFSGNPDTLVGYADATRTTGERDYFRLDVPWKAFVDKAYNSDATLYAQDGSLAGSILDPGTYYFVSSQAASSYPWSQSVMLRRYVSLAGGADIPSATDLDPYFSPTADGRVLKLPLKSGQWYSFTAAAGEFLSPGVPVYRADGSSISANGIILASGRYYLRASDIPAALSVESALDLTSALAASDNGHGVRSVSVPFIQGDAFDSQDRLMFTLNQPATLVSYQAYGPDGTLYSSGALLQPGTYSCTSSVQVKVLNFGSPVNADSLFRQIDSTRRQLDTPAVDAGIFTFTVSEGQLLTLSSSGLYSICDAQGKAVPTWSDSSLYYMVSPGTYTLKVYSKDQPVSVTAMLVQCQQLTLPEITPGSGCFYSKTTQYSGYRYFKASSAGVLYGDTAFWQAGVAAYYNIAFDAGATVWVSYGSELFADCSGLDNTSVNDTMAKAINADSLWWQRPGDADYLNLTGSANSSTGEAWYSIHCSAGDYLSDRAAGGAQVDLVDYNGVVLSLSKTIAASGTYYLRVRKSYTSGGTLAQNLYGVMVFRLSGTRTGGSSSSTAVPLDSLYTPGQPLTFNAVTGGYFSLNLKSDVTWSVQSAPIFGLFSSYGSSVTLNPPHVPNGTSTIYIESYPGRITITVTPTDEAEPNDTLATATDITSHLISGGWRQYCSVTGAITYNQVDIFKVRLTDYSTVVCSTSQALIELLNTNGDVVANNRIYSNVTDSHMEPGYAYIRVTGQNASGSSGYPDGQYTLNVQVSAGTPWAGDGNNTKDTATDLTSLMDGQSHTVNGDFARSSDEDWYVIKPTGTPMAVRILNSLSTPWMYEYDGQLYTKPMDYKSEAVVYDAPLYIQMKGSAGQTYTITVQKMNAVVKTLTPSGSDPSTSTYTSTVSEDVLIPLSMGSAVTVTGYQASYSLSQPFLTGPNPDGVQLVYRNTYAYLRSSGGATVKAVQYRGIDDQMVNTGAPGQHHYSFDTNLYYTKAMHTFWFYQPAGSQASLTGVSCSLGLNSSGPNVPSGACFFTINDDPGSGKTSRVTGSLWYSDETEPNDNLSSAQRIDSFWQPWQSSGRRLELAGSTSTLDAVDDYVFHLDPGQAISVSGASFGASFWGSHLVNRGGGIYTVSQASDVYLTGLTGNYRLVLVQGLDLPDAGDTADITAAMAGGGVTILGDCSEIQFQTAPGRVYYITGNCVVTDDSGNIIGGRDNPAPLAFVATGSFVTAEMSSSLYEVKDVTNQAIPLQFTAVDDTTRSATVTLHDGDVFTFDADANSLFQPILTPNAYGTLFLQRADGTKAGPFSSNGYDFLGGTRRFAGYVKGSGDITLTLILRETEPVNNDVQEAATDVTDRLTATENSHTMTYQGVLSGEDTVDWLQVDLKAGQCLTTTTIDVSFSGVYGYWSNGHVYVTESGASDIARRTCESYNGPFIMVGGIAKGDETRGIKIIRYPGFTGPIYYSVTVTVRDAQPLTITDNGSDGFIGSAQGRLYTSATDNVAVYRVDVPAGRVFSHSGEAALLDAQGNYYDSAPVTTMTDKTFYLVEYVKGYSYSDYSISVSVNPLWDLNPELVDPLDYQSNGLVRLQGNFTDQKSKWWRITLYKDQIITLGEPSNPADYTDLQIFRSTGVAAPSEVPVVVLPTGFASGRRFQILCNGDYYVMATPSVVSGGVQYDANVLVQMPGDADGDGLVTNSDYARWAANFGAINATFEMGDWNGDGMVSEADYTLWANNYHRVTVRVPGDFNGDGRVNDADYTVWADDFNRAPLPSYQKGQGTDGGYNDADYTIWADHYSFDLFADEPALNSPVLPMFSAGAPAMTAFKTEDITINPPRTEPAILSLGEKAGEALWPQLLPSRSDL